MRCVFFSPSCDTKSLCYTIILRFLLKYIFKKILPNFLLVYNIMLVSGIFHSDLTFTHIMKWSCGNSSNHLSSYKFIKIVPTVLFMVYITFPWLIYFITGELYLLIPFTYFSQMAKIQFFNGWVFHCVCIYMHIHNIYLYLYTTSYVSIYLFWEKTFSDIVLIIHIYF